MSVTIGCYEKEESWIWIMEKIAINIFEKSQYATAKNQESVVWIVCTIMSERIKDPYFCILGSQFIFRFQFTWSKLHNDSDTDQLWNWYECVHCVVSLLTFLIMKLTEIKYFSQLCNS